MKTKEQELHDNIQKIFRTIQKKPSSKFNKKFMQLVTEYYKEFNKKYKFWSGVRLYLDTVLEFYSKGIDKKQCIELLRVLLKNTAENVNLLEVERNGMTNTRHFKTVIKLLETLDEKDIKLITNHIKESKDGVQSLYLYSAIQRSDIENKKKEEYQNIIGNEPKPAWDKYEKEKEEYRQERIKKRFEDPIEIRVFKGDKEKTIQLSKDLQACKINDKRITLDDKEGAIENICNLIKLEENMDGFKFKACINCFYYMQACINKQSHYKLYCAPRLILRSDISMEESMYSTLIKSESFRFPGYKFFKLRMKMLQQDKNKPIPRMKSTDYCDHFLYTDQESKVKIMENWKTYQKKIREQVLDDEERWYWPDAKKKYENELKEARKTIENEEKFEEAKKIIRKEYESHE